MQNLRTNNKENKIIKQGGFTLFEVIAVLVILGILAAFAIPKFVDAQDMTTQKTLERAVAELNGQVAVAFSTNLLKSQEMGDYEGYTGSLGPDFDVTGQTNNKPDSGTIKLTNSSEVYTLIWTKKPAKQTHGIFALGPKL